MFSMNVCYVVGKYNLVTELTQNASSECLSGLCCINPDSDSNRLAGSKSLLPR